MKVVLDTNVILDVLANREPFVDDSEAVMMASTDAHYESAITANTVTDIAYILHKHLDKASLKAALLGLLELVSIIEVNHANCVGAFELQMNDCEDALLAHCAKSWGADYIVTRNKNDFAASPIAALTPSEFLSLIHER
jgi:Predicted nucleic acid-binding protein, contains PIN domain